MTTYTVKFMLRANISDILLEITHYFARKNLTMEKENLEQNYILFNGKSTDLFIQDLGKMSIQVWIFRNQHDSNLEIRFVFEFPKVKSIEGYEKMIMEEIKHVKKYVESRVSRDDDDSYVMSANQLNATESADDDKIVSPWCQNCHQYKGTKKICPHCKKHVG